MAFISVSYTFVNATTASATEVNANFTDIINGTSDGTKDLNVASITGTSLNISNNCTLGSSSGDDLTVNASLATSIPIKTTRTYDIGSADLGLRILYLGGNSTHTIAFQAPSSGMAADYSLNLPPTAPTVGYGMVATSTSALAFTPMQTDTNTVSSADYTVLDNDGYATILVTTGSSNRTVTLPTAADNTDRKITVVKVDSGTGHVIMAGESAELLTATNLHGQGRTASFMCDGTSWHLIAKSGGLYENANIKLNTPSGYGSTNTAIRIYTVTQVTHGDGAAFTYATSATAGASITINYPGLWGMCMTDVRSAGDAPIGFSVNSSQLTTSIYSITSADRIAASDAPAANVRGHVSAAYRFAKGDVLRPHQGGNCNGASTIESFAVWLIKPD